MEEFECVGWDVCEVEVYELLGCFGIQVVVGFVKDDGFDCEVVVLDVVKYGVKVGCGCGGVGVEWFQWVFGVVVYVDYVLFYFGVGVFVVKDFVVFGVVNEDEVLVVVCFEVVQMDLLVVVECEWDEGKEIESDYCVVLLQCVIGREYGECNEQSCGYCGEQCDGVYVCVIEFGYVGVLVVVIDQEYGDDE